MMTEEEKEAIYYEIGALRMSTDEVALEAVNRNPFIGTYCLRGKQRLVDFARVGFVATVRRLVELGSNLDLRDENTSSPIHAAVSKNHIEVARILLDAGANPNVERTILRAARTSPEMVSLLVSYGARLNDLYTIFGDKTNLQTTLDFFPKASPIYEFLSSIGAKTSAQVLAEDPKAPISDE